MNKYWQNKSLLLYNYELSTVDFFQEENTLVLDFPYDLQAYIKYFEDQFNFQVEDYHQFQLDSLAQVYDLIELYSQLNYVDCQPGTSPLDGITPPNFTSLDTAVTYTILNQQITGTNPYYLEFDLGISDNQNNIYFKGGSTRFEYDTITFPPDIDNAGKVWVTRGSLLSDIGTYKDPEVNDQVSNEINIGFFWYIPSVATGPYIDIPSTPTPAVHIKMEISNCNHPGYVKNVMGSGTFPFVDFGLAPTNPPTPFGMYGLPNYAAPINVPGCGPVQIFSVHPPVVAGGIGQTVTITGQNFGTSQGTGNVFLMEADQGGSFYISLDPNDITSWTNSEIKFVMPGLVDSTNTLNHQFGVPGTGALKVLTSLGDSAVDFITVLYSLTSSIENFTGTAEKFAATPADFSLNSWRGGIRFSLDTSFTNHTDRMIVIRKAIRDWVCLSNMHFVGEDSLISDSPIAKQDTNSMIQFGPLPIGTLAKTYLWGNAYLNGSNVCGVYYWRPDIIFSETYIDSLFCDTTKCDSLPHGLNDLYAIALHELGHAHGLNHVNGDVKAIMYYAKFTGQFPNTPSVQRSIWLRHDVSADSGSHKVMNNALDPSVVSCSVGNLIQPILITDCGQFFSHNITRDGCSLIGIDELEKVIGDVKLYPNPATSKLTIEFAGGLKDIELAILDNLGRSINEPYNVILV